MKKCFPIPLVYRRKNILRAFLWYPSSRRHGDHGDRFDCRVLYGFRDGTVWTWCKWHFLFLLLKRGLAMATRGLARFLLLALLCIYITAKNENDMKTPSECDIKDPLHVTLPIKANSRATAPWLTLLSARQLWNAIYIVKNKWNNQVCLASHCASLKQ